MIEMTAPGRLLPDRAMSQLPLLITVDAEGDDLWARPKHVETQNARFLPRFQALCEQYGFKVTYLVNFEMACCPAFIAFARDVQARGTGEIGMQLHAWNSPPLVALTADDDWYQPYLIEYPVAVLREKVNYMTCLLEDVFGTPITSHRAGRWALDGDYARALVENGYLVDCSVTPHISWAMNPGAPFGSGGSDYRSCPERPYWVDLDDPRRAGTSALLEVPMTIKAPHDGVRGWVFERFDTGAALRRVAERVRPMLSWLQPNGENRGAMLWLLDEVHRCGDAHAELALHSSELMPGGSPRFPTAVSIERLYDDIEYVFDLARGRFVGATLTEFHASMRRPAERDDRPVLVGPDFTEEPRLAGGVALAQARR